MYQFLIVISFVIADSHREPHSRSPSELLKVIVMSEIKDKAIKKLDKSETK